MRTFGIWLSGLIASGVAGGVVAVLVVHPSKWEAQQWMVLGAIGGACAFACARLWMTKDSN